MRATAILLLSTIRLMAGYSYCQPITISHTKVPNTDQANYVLTVNDTDPGLALVSHGGYVQNPNGYDVVFTSDAFGRNLLKWDVPEVFDSVTGRIVTHVQVGTLSHTADTVIYRCAGNQMASVFQGGARGAAWPSAYQAVWHLNETTGPQRDSTPNGNDSGSVSVASQGSATGQIGGADGISGTYDRVQIPAGSLSLPSAFTMSAWIRENNVSGNRAVLRIYAGGTDFGMYIRNGFGVLYASSYGDNVTGATSMAAGVWNHIAVVSNGRSQNGFVFVNGHLDGTAVVTSQGLGAISGISLCGDIYGQPLSGVCDEVRLANVALSADRIATDYNNQFSPQTFYAPGAWKALTAGGSAVSLF